MSFSSDVKEELSTRIDMARHCQIAEFAAIMGMSGRIRRASGKRMQIEMSTENEIARYKFIVLLEQIFDIDTGDIIYVSKSSRDTTIRIENQEYVAKILQTLKWADETFDNIEPVFVDPRIVQKDCCKKAFIRGAFIAAGSISDPNKFYHYEIVCDYEEDAQCLCDMLIFFGLDAKITVRKNDYIVYMKEGSNITDVLNLMGAYVSQMNLYNVMILKEMRNDVNRKDIIYIRDTVGLGSLKDSLRQVAEVRLEHEDMNLKDIGALLDPPVGKSGVNHRLRKISEYAEQLRLERGD